MGVFWEEVEDNGLPAWLIFARAVLCVKVMMGVNFPPTDGVAVAVCGKVDGD